MECEYENSLVKKLKLYKGQPIEVITKSGFKYCGIDVYADEYGVDIIDRCQRTVHIELRNIEALIEPRMKLNRLCGDNDCCCDEEDERRERKCCKCDCDQ